MANAKAQYISFFAFFGGIYDAGLAIPDIGIKAGSVDRLRENS